MQRMEHRGSSVRRGVDEVGWVGWTDDDGGWVQGTGDNGGWVA